MVLDSSLLLFIYKAGENLGIVPKALGLVAIALLVWRAFRFGVIPLIYPDDPKELPYWVPVWELGGHLGAFFGNADLMLSRARRYFNNTREPFALTILGMKTYVLTKAEDVGDVYRNTESLSFEEFVQAMMGMLGSSDSCIKTMFTRLPKDKPGFPNPHGRSMGILFRDMHIHQLFPGDNLTFLETSFQTFFHRCLQPEQLVQLPYATPDTPNSVVVPLVQWCSDYFVKASQEAYFGPKLAEIDPHLTDHFIVFDELSYQIIYQYPRFLAGKLQRSRDSILTGFRTYLELKPEQRTGDAWFIKAAEAEMRRLDLSSEDMSIALLAFYWAINTNSRKAAFWLLAHLVQTPSLLAAVREETAPAFRADGTVDLAYLHGASVPQLDAIWCEMLRLAAFSASVRFLTADTVVGGKTLRKGHRLMVPYRQLHMNEAVFGAHVEAFRPERFLQRPRLALGSSFKPFGGGVTYCPGRHIAKRAVLMFTAMVLARFDLEPAEQGQEMLQADLTKPVAGLMSPKEGNDMMVRLTPREKKKKKNV